MNSILSFSLILSLSMLIGSWAKNPYPPPGPKFPEPRTIVYLKEMEIYVKDKAKKDWQKKESYKNGAKFTLTCYEVDNIKNKAELLHGEEVIGRIEFTGENTCSLETIDKKLGFQFIEGVIYGWGDCGSERCRQFNLPTDGHTGRTIGTYSGKREGWIVA